MILSQGQSMRDVYMSNTGMGNALKLNQETQISSTTKR